MTGRERQLLREIPDILNYESLLYIGMSARENGIIRDQMINLFESRNYKIQVIEIWPPNVESLRPKFPNILLGDIRDLHKMEIGTYDIAMFWHGPEHLEKHEIPDVLWKLEARARKYAVVACPWGRYDQIAVGGNPHEIHRCRVYAVDFERLGWKTSVIGQKDVRGSNLMAWIKK